MFTKLKWTDNGKNVLLSVISKGNTREGEWDLGLRQDGLHGGGDCWVTGFMAWRGRVWQRPTARAFKISKVNERRMDGWWMNRWIAGCWIDRRMDGWPLPPLVTEGIPEDHSREFSKNQADLFHFPPATLCNRPTRQHLEGVFFREQAGNRLGANTICLACRWAEVISRMKRYVHICWEFPLFHKKRKLPCLVCLAGKNLRN